MEKQEIGMRAAAFATTVSSGRRTYGKIAQVVRAWPLAGMCSPAEAEEILLQVRDMLRAMVVESSVPLDNCPVCACGSYIASPTGEEYEVECAQCGQKWREPQ